MVGTVKPKILRRSAKSFLPFYQALVVEDEGSHTIYVRKEALKKENRSTKFEFLFSLKLQVEVSTS